MNSFVKAILTLIALASICSSAYAFYLIPGTAQKPAVCKDGWCEVVSTTVTEDGSLQQTSMKAWVGVQQ